MLGKAGVYGGKTLAPKDSGVDSPLNLYVYCENVDTFHKKAVEAGAISLGAPDNMFWGDRMCRLQIPMDIPGVLQPTSEWLHKISIPAMKVLQKLLVNLIYN